ncbi:MAG: type IV secretion system DNA-binding domain-containing protein [bacterium]|nr:type IV secretion system DNA-binding domain-containing protein [bacterium]
MEDSNKITYLAQTDSRNRKVPFGIKARDRSRHVYVIGKTGMGKSTLLENMAVQDMREGNGMAFIDPHGKTAELLLDYVPEHRIKDVLYFAPFDMEYPISFNILEDVGPDRRHLVANGLMSTFEKIWVDAWSARMSYILNNTILALLEFPDATLLGVNRMFADKEYRKRVVDNITDPSIRSFWVDEYAKYTDRYTQEATPAIQNKVGQFTSNPLIRNIIGQPRSSFDLRKIMDEKKIVIVNLSKGLVGEGNANLLGSMLITKMYLSAMSRADTHEVESRLPNFYLYVDEFQSFANKSFADILSEARKYKLNLTIAHQYIEQMEEEVRAAVFGNVGTTVAFRVGAFDAEVLEKEFAPQFTAEDLVNLGFVQIYLKLMIDGISSPPFSATTLPPIEKPLVSYKDRVIASSREVFGQPRFKVEENIWAWHSEFKYENNRSDPRDNRSDLREKPKNTKPDIGNRPNVHMERQNAPYRGNSSEDRRNPTKNRNEIPINKTNVFTGNGNAVSGGPKSPSLHLSNLQAPRKVDVEQKKAPTGQHLSELRAALASVLESENNKNNTAGALKESQFKRPEPRPVNPQRPEEKKEPKAPSSLAGQEVPENILRETLRVEGE